MILFETDYSKHTAVVFTVSKFMSVLEYVVWHTWLCVMHVTCLAVCDTCDTFGCM